MHYGPDKWNLVAIDLGDKDECWELAHQPPDPYKRFVLCCDQIQYLHYSQCQNDMHL
jgi:hypothetical protein